MEPIEGFETSAFKPRTPGKYPKENILQKMDSLLTPLMNFPGTLTLSGVAQTLRGEMFLFATPSSPPPGRTQPLTKLIPRHSFPAGGRGGGGGNAAGVSPLSSVDVKNACSITALPAQTSWRHIKLST